MSRTPRHYDLTNDDTLLFVRIFNGRVIPVVGAILDGSGAMRADLLLHIYPGYSFFIEVAREGNWDNDKNRIISLCQL